jgi:hypothetical protein
MAPVFIDLGAPRTDGVTRKAGGLAMAWNRRVLGFFPALLSGKAPVTSV